MSIHTSEGVPVHWCCWQMLTNLNHAVGRLSSGKYIPYFCELTSSIWKPHQTLPSPWHSIIADLYCIFSGPVVTPFVHYSTMRVWSHGQARRHTTSLTRFHWWWLFFLPSEFKVLLGLITRTLAFSCCESTATLRYNCLYAVLDVDSVSKVSCVNWTKHFKNENEFWSSASGTIYR